MFQHVETKVEYAPRSNEHASSIHRTAPNSKRTNTAHPWIRSQQTPRSTKHASRSTEHAASSAVQFTTCTVLRVTTRCMDATARYLFAACTAPCTPYNAVCKILTISIFQDALHVFPSSALVVHAAFTVRVRCLHGVHRARAAHQTP